MNPIGSTLQQRYQILEQLGQNGSVTTYLAIDLQVPGNLQLKCVIHRYELLDPAPGSADWDRAVLSAQSLYSLSRRVNSPQERLCQRLPMVYGYFAQADAFYIVREFIAGVALAQELSPDRVWTQSQIVMLLKELLEVLRDLHRDETSNSPILLSQLIRRMPDRQLVSINLPMAIGAPPPQPAVLPPWDDLRMVGEITIAAAIGIAGSELPLTASHYAQWSKSSQVNHPELIAIIDR